MMGQVWPAVLLMQPKLPHLKSVQPVTPKEPLFHWIYLFLLVFMNADKAKLKVFPRTVTSKESLLRWSYLGFWFFLTYTAHLYTLIVGYGEWSQVPIYVQIPVLPCIITFVCCQIVEPPFLPEVTLWVNRLSKPLVVILALALWILTVILFLSIYGMMLLFLFLSIVSMSAVVMVMVMVMVAVLIIGVVGCRMARKYCSKTGQTPWFSLADVYYYICYSISCICIMIFMSLLFFGDINSEFVKETKKFSHGIILKSSAYPEIAQYSWEKGNAGQKQHFQTKFSAKNNFVGLHSYKNNLSTTTARKLFTRDEQKESLVTDTLAGMLKQKLTKTKMALLKKKWSKTDEKLLLYITTDPIGVPVDFYLNTDPPDENDPIWDQVIEGFINFSTGKLFASDELLSDPRLEIILPQKGIYKFRVYYGGLDYKLSEVEEHWQIYLWPTDETKESNEIKVIKAFNPA